MPHAMPPFFLASESPRRQHILTEAGFQFTVLPIKVSERIEKNLNLQQANQPWDEVAIQDLAKRKMQAALTNGIHLNLQDYLILTADTMVVLDGTPLGKPSSREDAIQTLVRLSGHSHFVKTAVCLYRHQDLRMVWGLQSTQVNFRPLLRHEIEVYVDSGEPLDKAGSYAIQGQGGKFVVNFDGDFDNVVGLPMRLVKELLQKVGCTW